MIPTFQRHETCFFCVFSLLPVAREIVVIQTKHMNLTRTYSYLAWNVSIIILFAALFICKLCPLGESNSKQNHSLGQRCYDLHHRIINEFVESKNGTECNIAITSAIHTHLPPWIEVMFGWFSFKNCMKWKSQFNQIYMDKSFNIHHLSNFSWFPYDFIKSPHPTSPINWDRYPSGVIDFHTPKTGRPTSRCPKKDHLKTPFNWTTFWTPQKYGDGRRLKWIVVGFFPLLDF